jgi:hypothetical protein
MLEQPYAAFCLFILLSSGVNLPLQREEGASRVAGRVSPAFKLSIRRGWHPSGETLAGESVRVAVDPAGPKTLEVTLSGSGLGGATQIALPLEIRTNGPYDLKLTLISEECPPAIAASIGSVRASGSSVVGGAGHVTRYKGLIDLARCVKPVTALHGPRVSRSGNFETPGNALSADLNLSISPYTGNQCSWRARFRISLQASY